MTKDNKRKPICSLCLQKIHLKVYYVDKYPHHLQCKAIVLKYLKTKGK